MVHMPAPHEVVVVGWLWLWPLHPAGSSGPAPAQPVVDKTATGPAAPAQKADKEKEEARAGPTRGGRH